MSAKPKKTLTSNTTSAYSLRRRNWELRNDSSNVSGLLSRSFDEDSKKRVLCSQRSTRRRSKNFSTHNCEECYCKQPPLKPALNIKPPKLERVEEKTPKKHKVKYGNRNCCRIFCGESSEEFGDEEYEPFHKLPNEDFSKLAKRNKYPSISSRNFLENYETPQSRIEETDYKTNTFGERQENCDCYLCEKCTRNKDCHVIFDKNKRYPKNLEQITTSRENGDSSTHRIKECACANPPCYEEYKKHSPKCDYYGKRPHRYKSTENFHQKRHLSEEFCRESSEDSSNEKLHQYCNDECQNFVNKNCCGGDASNPSSDNDKRIANVKNIREEFFFETHSTVNLEEAPPHRCVHEFILNDRLIPEPINADVYGTSRCAICNKPMQTQKTTPPQDNPKKSKTKPKATPPKFKQHTFAPRQINIGANDEIVNIKILNNSIANITERNPPKRPPLSNSLALRFQKLDKH